MKNRNLRTGSTAAALTAVVVALTFVLASCGDAGGGPGGTPPVYYTVNYSAGEGTGTAPASQTVLAGTTITLPGKGNLAAPIAEETFGGWSDGRLHAAGTPYTVNATVTLTAKWGFAGIDAISAYLGTVTGAAASPAPLRVLLNLADGTNGWAALLAGIQTAGNYVALDLSACAVTGMTATAGEFDPDRTLTGDAKNGKGFVVSLVLPETATAIKAETEFSNSAFQDFTALKTVCGANVITIGENAFRDTTGLISIDFPRAATIGKSAFDDCSGLTSIAFPQVTTIGDNAFVGCGLVSIDFPKAATIGKNAFRDMTGLVSVDFPKATTIGDDAFSDCTGLISIDFPRAATIGSHAFEDCTGLNNVSLPATLTTVGDNPFVRCTSLTNLTVAAGNTHFIVENGILIYDNTTVITGLPAVVSGSVTLPSITTVPYGAFYGCTALTSVDLSQATTTGSEAFYGCTALTSVSLPQATNIGSNAFGSTGTTALTVTLGASPPAVGAYMFSGVTGGPKTVTVRVPSASIGSGTGQYNDTWKTAFQGAGGSSAAADGVGTENTDVTVNYQGY